MSSRLIEKYVQCVRMNGIVTKKAVDFSGAPSVALPAAGMTLGNAANPVLSFSQSASATTGIQIQSASATGNVTIAVTSSGSNEALVLAPKGSGTLKVLAAGSLFGANANGGSGSAIKLGSLGDANNAYVVAQGSGTDVALRLRAQGAGAVALHDNVALPAGGSAGVTLLFSAGTIGVYVGSGAPSVSAAQGSLYLRSDGSSTSTRAYINNSAGSGTTWTAITTAA